MKSHCYYLEKVMKPACAVLLVLRIASENAFSGSTLTSAAEGTVTVRVQTPDGQAVPNAPVVCFDSSTNALLEGTTIHGGNRIQADAHGRFSFKIRNEYLYFMLATDTGFCLAQSRDLIKEPTMVVEPWGRIEGIRTTQGRPVAGEQIEVMFDWKCINSSDFKTSVGSGGFERTTTDSTGHFVIDHVPPLGLVLLEMPPGKKAWNSLAGFQIRPGENKFIQYAVDGRIIIGRLELANGLPGNLDLRSCGIILVPASARHAIIPAIPKEYDTPERRTQWWEDWYQSDAGKVMFRHLGEGGARFEVQSNGILTSDAVVHPGKYRVTGGLWNGRKKLAKVDEYVVIPGDKPGETNNDFDIGTVMLKPAVQVGGVCPDFDVAGLDGKSLKLLDFRGKYVLLDFWATWCGPCVRETPNLKATYNAFGKNSRFAMVSLSLDEDIAAPRQWVRRNGVSWMQGFLGDWEQDRVTKDFEVEGIPSIWLIGPDGKIISRDLRGVKIKEAVAAALNGG